MKKVLYILLSFAFIACSSSKDSDPCDSIKDPKKRDIITIEQIVGRYELPTSPVSDKGNIILAKYKPDLIFRADYKGEEVNTETLEKRSFTWSYSNGFLIFEHSEYGSLNCWFKYVFPPDFGLYFKTIFKNHNCFFEYRKV